MRQPSSYANETASNRPLVSIVVPVYNIESYINRCLDSLLNQTYRNIEVIVVDDGSTDSTAGICDLYGAADERVTVLHQANKGVSAARNRGIEEARGEFLWFVDGDDEAVQGAVESFVSAAEQSGADLVVCAIDKCDEKGSVFGRIPAPADNPSLLEQGPLQSGNELYPFAHFARAKLLHDLRFTEGLVLLEDRQFMYRLCLKARGRTSVISDSLYRYYCMRPGSATNDGLSKKYIDGVNVHLEILLSEISRGQVDPAYQLFVGYTLGVLGGISKTGRLTQHFNPIRDMLLEFDQYSKHIHQGKTKLKYFLFTRLPKLAKGIWRVYGRLRKCQ